MSVGLFDTCDMCGFPSDDLRSTSEGECCPFCARQIPVDEKSDFAPRTYQQECESKVLEEFRSVKSTLVVMATGTGKTISFGNLIANPDTPWAEKRVLIMAHRDELIQQAADKVGRILREPCDIEMGELRADQRANLRKVVVTSVQTMSRYKRLSRFDPSEFGLMVVDEAHHAPAPTYLKVIEHFQQNHDLCLLGVTATPDRADELAMGRVFASVAYEYGIVDAVDDGWLVPVEQQFVIVDGLDVSEVKMTAGDLNQRQLGEIMREESTAHKVVDSTISLTGDRPTLVFAVDVAQAEMMSDIANRHQSGIADWICGDAKLCPMDRRRDVLKRFSNGSIQYLFNCMIASEGFDQPNIACVAIARPTKSRSLYAQMIGRGTRPLPGVVDRLRDAESRLAAIAGSGKPNVLILDFVGNSGRHKLIHTGDLLGGDYDTEVVAQATRSVQAASRRGERMNMLEALRAAEHDIKEERRKRRAAVIAKAKFRTRSVNPFDVLDVLPKREPGWHKGRAPTPKMLAYLEKRKVATEGLSFWEAKQLIGEMIQRQEKGLCSYPQAKVLLKFGFPCENVTFEEASATIDKIAKSGWKLRGPG